MQQILPSLHVLEIFMPIVHDENFLVNQILPKVADIPFYKGIELGVIDDSNCRSKVRKIVEDKDYQLTTWLSPSIINRGYNLSSLDSSLRKKSIDFTIDLIKKSVDANTTHCGLPCGPDIGDEKREDAKKALFDSYCELLKAIEEYPNIDLTFEPLDRHASKKMLMGPIEEVVEMFALLRKESDRIFIHWDSAHETLMNKDLLYSISLAQPYLAQIHLCNCVNDSKHPCYGDYHMDVGQAPDFSTWGYLTPEEGAKVIKKLSTFDKAKGVNNTFCAVEVRSHMGDDFWAKERLIRSFLMRTFDIAGMPYDGDSL